MLVCAVLRSVRLFPTRNNLKLNLCACYQQNFFSAKAPTKLKILKEVDPNTGEVKKKKTPIVPKITLLSGDSISVTTLQEAQKMSKRRDLKLVKIVDIDTKTQRPVYKLMTGTEYHAEDLKQREQRKKEKEESFIKGEKVLLLNSKITQHDLETQLRKCLKWIQKSYEVRVVINKSSPSNDLDALYTEFEGYFKKEGSDARFMQKRMKGDDLRFQIIPPKRDSSKDNDNSSNNNDDDKKPS